MTRPHAPTKKLRDKDGNLLPSSLAELKAAGLDYNNLYPKSVAKKLNVAIESEPCACSHSHGNWYLLYKAI